MTNTNGSDRLDRIEALLEETIKITQSNARAISSNSRDIADTRAAIVESKSLVDSNSKAIQAILDQRASDQLKHEAYIKEQQEINLKLARYIDGLGNMMSKIDENQPSILRKLTTIENKLDSLQTIETKLDRLIEDK